MAFTMSKILAVLACLAVVLAVVSAESKPRYHKLEKLGCTLDQVLLCTGEIEAAWNNCWDSADIQTCIAGIVGLLTVEPVSVMFCNGWDSTRARFKYKVLVI